MVSHHYGSLSCRNAFGVLIDTPDVTIQRKVLLQPTGPACLASPVPELPTHGRHLPQASLLAPQLQWSRLRHVSGGKLAQAPTSLNTIFTSQQQQEALPDETEVVEETVAEVAEVGGGGPRLLSANIRSPWGIPTMACWNRPLLPFSHAHSTDVNPVDPPMMTHSRVLPKLSLEPHRWEL